jgi:hypothetical protein
MGNRPSTSPSPTPNQTNQAIRQANQTKINQANLRDLKSRFTNNAMVFYKPGSLASCGVGTVRNSSAKSSKI